jgi:hypothetical protein
MPNWKHGNALARRLKARKLARFSAGISLRFTPNNINLRSHGGVPKS